MHTTEQLSLMDEESVLSSTLSTSSSFSFGMEVNSGICDKVLLIKKSSLNNKRNNTTPKCIHVNGLMNYDEFFLC